MNEKECTTPPASDGSLLARYVDSGDGEAFAELVSRYASLVRNVCRRVLRDEGRADDACQAAFFILAQKAAHIRNGKSLAGWLYAVAYRIARRHRAAEIRRREEPLQEYLPQAPDDTFADVARRHEQQVLDEELHQLPARFRDPLVLHFLMGKSNREVARHLSLTVGIIDGRLKRAKLRLRLRLARRGFDLIIALAAVRFSGTIVEAAECRSLADSTLAAAKALKSGTQPGQLSPSSMKLAQMELISMGTSTWSTIAAAATLVIAALLAGIAAATAMQTSHAGTPSAKPISIAFSDDTPAELDGAFVTMTAAPPNARTGFSLNQLSAAEQKIAAALEETTDIEFIETPLQDVADFLADNHNIKIILDRRSLDSVGIGAETPVTQSLFQVSLRSAMRIVLRDLELTYLVRDEVLEITTRENAEAFLETRVYQVRSLEPLAPEAIEQVIRVNIQPDRWRVEGKPDGSTGATWGSISALPEGILVVTHNQFVHEQVVKLLQQLSRLQNELRTHSGTSQTNY